MTKPSRKDVRFRTALNWHQVNECPLEVLGKFLISGALEEGVGNPVSPGRRAGEKGRQEILQIDKTDN